MLDRCRAHDVAWLFYTGGNGSMETARQIAAAARASGSSVGVIGVPKTIDNDLAGTDHAPGYASAARFFGSLRVGRVMGGALRSVIVAHRSGGRCSTSWGRSNR